MALLRIAFSLTLLLALAPAHADQARAQQLRQAIPQLLNDGTLLVAAAEVDGAWFDGLADVLVDYGALPPNQREVMEKQLEMGAGIVARLRELGAREAVVVAAVGDLSGERLPVLALLCDAPQRDALAQMLEQLVPQPNPLSVRWVGDVLFLGHPKGIDHYAALAASPRGDLLEPLVRSIDEGAGAAAVLSPGADVRRVLRELWPTLPPPLRGLNGALVADGVKSLELAVRRPSQWRVDLTLTAADEAAAAALAEVAAASIDFGVITARSRPGMAPMLAAIEQAAGLLRPGRDGATLRITVSHDDTAAAALARSVVVPAASQAQQNAQRMSQMNDLKQLGLAMHNFADVNKCLPAAAIRDKDGAPLLSWRVALLPYFEDIEGQKLYERFHMDEPWDSPHNLKVAQAARPETLFANMSPELRAAGKTTYLVPIAEGTGFAPIEDAELFSRTIAGRKAFFPRGVSFRNVTDGLSNTILIAHVADEHAVFWTKPDDWEVDLADPLAKLRQAGRDGFLTAYMDGSAHFLPFDVKPELIKNALTIAGGEVEGP